MSIWSALFNGGDAEDEDEDEHSWWEKGLSFGGEVVDRSVGIGYGVAGTLGGVTSVVAGESAKKLNDIALGLDWRSEAKHAETERLLDAHIEGSKMYTAVTAGNTINALDPTTVDLDQRLDDSEGYWDLLFMDSAEDVGDGMTAFAYGAESSLDGEPMDLEELEKLREQVAKIEDEVLAAIFVFVPFALLPKLRILLAAAAPGMLNLVIQAAASGTNLALDVINFFMELLGLDPVSEEDMNKDEDETEEVEEEEEETVAEETEPTEPPVVDEEPMPDQELDFSAFKETWPEGNEFMEREIIY